MALFDNNNTAIYNQKYNALIKAINETFNENRKLAESANPSVTQEKLNTLRNHIRSLADRGLTSLGVGSLAEWPEQLKCPHDQDCFKDRAVEINGGKGFLVLPGKYNSLGKDIYQFDDPDDYWTGNARPISVNIPPLPEHFEDLKNALEQIKYYLPVNGPNCEINNSKGLHLHSPSPDPKNYDDLDKELRDEGGTGFVASSSAGFADTTGGCGINLHQQSNHYSANDNGSHEAKLLIFEQEIKRERQTGKDPEEENGAITCEIVGSSYTVTHQADDFKDVWEKYSAHADDGDYSYKHTYEARALQVYQLDQKVKFEPGGNEDTSDNDLLGVGCGGVTPGKTESGNHQWRTYLGSCGNCPEVYLALYFSNIRMPDADIWTASMDTKIFSDAHGYVTIGKRPSAQTGFFRFTRLVRPNGYLATLAWEYQNDTAVYAKPIDGGGYRMYDNFVVEFSDGVRHYYNPLSNENISGTFIRAEKEVQGERRSVTWPDGCLSGNGSTGTAATNECRATFQYRPGCHSDSHESEQSALYGIQFFQPDGVTPLARSATGQIQFGKVEISGDITVKVYRKSSPSATAPMPLITEFTMSSRLATDDDSTVGRTAYLDPTDGSVYAQEIVSNPSPAIYQYRQTRGDSEFTHEKIYKQIAGQRRMIGESRGAGNEERTTNFVYWDAVDADGKTCAGYGRLRLRQDPDKSWVHYTYDDSDRVIEEMTPFDNNRLSAGAYGDLFFPMADANRVIEYSYSANVEGETALPGDNRVRRVIEKTLGVETARRYFVYLPNEYREVICRRPGAAVDAADNIVTLYYSNASGDYAGRRSKVVYPDGTVSLITYAAIIGGGETITTAIGVPDSTGTDVTDGTKIVEITDKAGKTTRRQTVDIKTGLITDQVDTTYYLGKPYRVTYLDGSTETTEYACCGPLKITHRDGSVTEYKYTPDKRVAQETHNQTVTTHEYDAVGNEIRTTVFPEGVAGSPVLLTLKEYATNGELRKLKVALEPVTGADPAADSAYAVTAYSSGMNDDYWRKTTINPDGGAVIEDYNADGVLYERSGTAAVQHIRQSEGMTDGEYFLKTVLIRDGVNPVEDTSIYTNFLGRQYKTVFYNGNTAMTEYDAAGRESYHTDRTGMVTLNQYNAKGELWKHSILISGRRTASGADNLPGPTDPITEYQNDVIPKTGHAGYGIVRQQVFEYDDNATTGTLVKTVETCNIDNSVKTIENGLITMTVKTYYNSSDEQGMGEIITNPDGSTVGNSYVAGLLESSENSVLGATGYEYDGFQRLSAVEKNDGGTLVRTEYTYDGRGNAISEITTFNGANARTTTRGFDKMNRLLTETQPGGRTVTRIYHLTGELDTVSGYGAYPQSYTWENGRIKTLSTYRSGFGTANPVKDTTTWVYNLNGMLKEKQYADGAKTTYSYDSVGRLTARNWSRPRPGTGGDYTKLYAYWPGLGTLLQQELYYDVSPTVTYFYDRRNRLKRAKDESGNHWFTYNSRNLLESETIPYYFDRQVKYEYDACNRVVKSGVYNPANSQWEMATQHTYESGSRLATLSGLGKTATYTRLAESNRLSRVDFDPDYPAAVYGYDAQLRPTGKGDWARQYNAKDEVIQSIPAGIQVNNLSWFYSYDIQGQLDRAVLGIIAAEGPTGRTFDYSYDSAGNHQLSGVTYNALNQPDNLTYDADGNMTGDGMNQYEYDAENRLIRILGPWVLDTCRSGVVFHYDYAGRCYRRDNIGIETDPNFPEGNFQTPYEYIIYDGVKQIMTLDDNKEPTGKYVWQPPSSGDADVILWDESGVYSTDLNKNVTGYHTIPGEPGQPGSTYFDYTPFGEPLNGSRRFGFSSEERFAGTQYIQTNLLLYLYRAYSPALKRWLTRDPIGEQGGVNLYNFVGNNPVTFFDENGNGANSTSSPSKVTPKQPIDKNSSAVGNCIDIFVTSENIKGKLDDDDREKLIDAVKKLVQKEKIQAAILSLDVVKKIGTELLADIGCCYFRMREDLAGDPCQKGYRTKSEVHCQDCCDFKHCKTLLIGGFIARIMADNANKTCHAKCCDYSK